MLTDHFFESAVNIFLTQQKRRAMEITRKITMLVA